MSRLARPVVVATLALSLSPVAAAHAARTDAAAVPSRPRITSGLTFVVNTAPTAQGMASAVGAIGRAGGQVTASWKEIGVTVGVVDDARIAAAVASIRRSPGIVSVGATGQLRPQDPAVPRRKVTAPKGADNPRFAVAARVPAAWTGRGVTIGVADDGVFDEHADVAARMNLAVSGSCTQGGAFLQGRDEWRPRSTGDTHGTGVASVAAGTAGNGGIRGVAPQATVVAMRVVSPNGDIYPEASICAAMRAARLRLPIVNHSYGLDHVVSTRHALWDPQNPDHAAAIAAVKKAFAYSRAHGVLHIAATGNSGDDLAEKSRIPVPESDRSRGPIPDRMVAMLGQVPGILGVGESDTDGTVMPSSTSGLGIVDISAVGNGMIAKQPGQWEWDAGTSFASPAVAGVAALVKQANPRLGPDGIEQTLYLTAQPRSCVKAGELISEQPCRTSGGRTSWFGFGIVDATRATARAVNGRG